MNFLSIDCSTDIGSIFVKFKYRSFRKILQSDKFNNDLLMKQILDFFEKNNLKLEDMSKILVNQGPGNFSGLRTSLAIAKGISLSKDLELFGYDAFIWPCAKFFKKQNSILSLIKFGKKYFLKKFDKDLNTIINVEEITESELLRKYNKKFIVIAESAVKNFDKKILKFKNLNIVNLDHKELEFLQLKGLLDKDLIKPLYLS